MTGIQPRHPDGGEPEITGDEHGMTRRQLMRHTAWFGAAVALTVTGSEVSVTSRATAVRPRQPR